MDARAMTISEVLRAAREKYASSPSHAPPGLPVPIGYTCPITAVCYVVSWEQPFAGDALHAFQVANGIKGISLFNYEHSTEDVLAAFDRAIDYTSDTKEH